MVSWGLDRVGRGALLVDESTIRERGSGHCQGGWNTAGRGEHGW